VALSPVLEPVTRTRSLDARRALDVVVALAALILLSPVLTLAAFAVWLEGGRPIFFSQIRLGQSGRPFSIYKFRKFLKVSASAGRAVTIHRDPRLTPVGRFLERTKCDELPQLWNILKGDMSVVGPRPESLSFADCFTGEYRDVLNHKPGLFGPVQVYFRNEVKLYPQELDPEQFYRQVLFPLKAKIDLSYFRQRTILDDVWWVFRGVCAVLGFRAFMPAEVRTTVSNALSGPKQQLFESSP